VVSALLDLPGRSVLVELKHIDAAVAFVCSLTWLDCEKQSSNITHVVPANCNPLAGLEVKNVDAVFIGTMIFCRHAVLRFVGRLKTQERGKT
jgi:hypothetical protein